MDVVLLKKVVAAFLFPLPVCLGLLLGGLILLWRGRLRGGRRLVMAGVVLLVVSTTGPLPGCALRSLEWQYAPHAVSPAPGYTSAADQPESGTVAWIVVLGGGATDTARLPISDRLSGPSMARVVEGVRLMEHYPGAQLLLCGGRLYDDELLAEAVLMQTFARFIGADTSRIQLEARSRNTEEQARYVRRIAGAAPLVLVTSAAHMPRAMALFRKQGLNPVPAPTDHYIKDASGPPMDWRYVLPASGHLDWLQRAWHERLGLWWAWLSGSA